MKKILLLFISVVLFSGFLHAQVDTVTHMVKFQSSGQNYWGPNSSDGVDIDKTFLDYGWNEGGSVGSIRDIAGYDFGARFTGSTWGHFGAGLRIKVGTEHVAVDYLADVKLKVPDSNNFDRGDEVTIETSYSAVNDSCKINYDKYNTTFDLWLQYRLGASLGGQACIFDCLNIPVVNFDIGDTISLIKFSPSDLEFLGGEYTPGQILLNEFYDYGTIVIFCPPGMVSTPAPICCLKLTLHRPENSCGEDTTYVQNNILYCRSKKGFEYVKLEISIPRLIGEILKGSPDPDTKLIGTILCNLSNGLSFGEFNISYNILKAGFDLDIYHNRRLSFSPSVSTQMKFPTAVDYKVYKPDNSLVSFGTDSIVDCSVGNKVKFKYPCNYEFMEISSKYSISNSFTNHTYDSLAFNFFFSMIEFHFQIPEIEVIPEICWTIYEPCGPWYCYFCDWCYCCRPCTPAVVFHGTDVSFGPLVSWHPNLFNFNYDWNNRTWALGGFSSVPAAPFRLTPKPYYVQATSAPVSCFGGNNGSVTATVTNGVPPYTFEWSGGSQNVAGSSFTMNNLGSGTQYVMVTDAKGCQTFTDVIISQPVAALSVNANITHAGCNGVNSGHINLTPSGGTPPYSFNWNSGQTTEDLDSIVSGNYWVTVTDSKSCTSVQNYTVQQPLPMVVNQQHNNISCFGDSTGTASVTVIGGIAPYAFSWSTGNATPSVSGLAAGSYTVSITDYNGCVNTQEIQIVQPADAVDVSVTSRDVLCYGGSSGYIHIVPSGGTAPYLTTWYDQEGQVISQTAASLDSVMPGTYQAIVTDQQGCHTDTTITISQPAQISWSFLTTDNLCFGESEGTIDLTVNGGVLPYGYSWSNGADTNVLSALPAGNYYVTITDSNHCVQYANVLINQPTAPVAAIVNPVQVLCFGEPTGSADLVPSGGTPPYTYLWSNGAQTEDLSGVPAGTYTVTVTDANMCEGYSGTTIIQPLDSLSVNIVVTDATCHGQNNGSIQVSASGGTTPYYIRWDNTDYLLSNSGHLLENLGAGSYQLIVTDASGCQFQQLITIAAPEAIHLEATTSLVHCFAGSDGAVDLTVTGGTLPYSYDWSNDQTSEDLSGVAAGNYSVTVTDAGGCSSSLNVTVSGMTEIVVTGTVVPVSCIDNTDGRISVTASGGAGGYTYLWSSGSNQTALTNLPSGDLSLTVTDAYGCSRSFEFFIPGSEQECISIPASFTPNGDGTNDLWVVRNINLYPGNSVKIFNRWGNLVYEASPYEPAWDGTFNGAPVPAETYYYIINLNNGTEPFNGTVTIIR